MRWDGWGDPARAEALPFAVRSLLPLLLGRVRRPAPGPAREEVRLEDPALTAADLEAFRALLGSEHVRTDAESRIRHAGGRSTPDLLRRRDAVQAVPDAILAPGDHAEVAACLRMAAERDVAVIPFGGGTSVVGALDPERGEMVADEADQLEVRAEALGVEGEQPAEQLGTGGEIGHGTCTQSGFRQRPG